MTEITRPHSFALFRIKPCKYFLEKENILWLKEYSSLTRQYVYKAYIYTTKIEKKNAEKFIKDQLGFNKPRSEQIEEMKYFSSKIGQKIKHK